ncbi:Com family DNA-binding transcriptional regulator [Salmonella enterica]|uniref:Com family DNA-binding transcriptional regulator n=1 Tax=Salmonella enterica TaxID=28901 RepID=UPI0039B56C9D
MAISLVSLSVFHILKKVCRMTDKMQVRCIQCSKLLFKGQIVEVQIKCPRCGFVNEVSAFERLTRGYYGSKGFSCIKPSRHD